MPNRLANEKSPYLRQHMHNPVDWFPWGQEAFAAARDRQVPIFLSIGYSSCYWCHVMEKDSFESAEVAEVLNANFVSVKVDREERPDVDKLYMDTVQGLTGQGGWPLSVFMTPDGEPFWGATFFYRPQFLRILHELSRIWTDQREGLTDSAREIVEQMRRSPVGNGSDVPIEDLAARAYRSYIGSFDADYGGFGEAPKFPQAPPLKFLFRAVSRFGATLPSDPDPRESLLFTLDSIARGGIFDHAGGGFHRYSVDRKWLVPHFEKMLYDNAQLLETFVEGYRLSGSESFRHVIEATVGYLARELRAPEGGFYAAEDAGEVGKEGEFYVWRPADIQAVLKPDQVQLITSLFGVTEEGNFDHHTTVLHLPRGVSWEQRLRPEVNQALRDLLEARKRTRPAPHRDEKILTGWNGLTIAALAQAAATLSRGDFGDMALSAAQFLKGTLYRDGALYRRYCDGETAIPAMLEDFTYAVYGLLRLYEYTFDPQWLDFALDLQRLQDAALWDDHEGAYFIGGDPELVVRQKEIFCGVTPSPNGTALWNLWRLELHTAERSFGDRARRLEEAHGRLFTHYPAAVPTALSAKLEREWPREEVVIVGGGRDELDDFLQAFARRFLPQVVVVAGTGTQLQGSALFRNRAPLGEAMTFYLCRDGMCETPTTDTAAVRRRYGLEGGAPSPEDCRPTCLTNPQQ